jgi:hypothetical protein
MEETVKAVIARGNGDATLIGGALLNGQHVYRSGPDVLIENYEAICTVWTVTTGNSGGGLPRASEVIQIDTYAKTAALADAVAKRWRELLDHRQDIPASGTLPGLTGRRLEQPVYLEPSPGDQIEADRPEKIHHRPQQFRVISYPT